MIGPSIDDVERAMDAVKYGHVAEEPVLEATIPSLADPSLAPEGKHVMSVVFQAAPRHLRDGDWSDERDRVGDIAVKTLERYAPGFGELVEAREVITPEDMERDYALTGGRRAARGARRSTSSSRGGRCSARRATASCSTGCSSRARARTPAAASPVARARTPRRQILKGTKT